MTETTTTKTAPTARPYQVGQIVRDLPTGAIARIVEVSSHGADHFYKLDDSVPLRPEAGFSNRSRHAGEVVDAVSENYRYLAHSIWDVVYRVKVNGTNGDLDDADLALARVAAIRQCRRGSDEEIEAHIEKLLARIRAEVAERRLRAAS